MLIILAEHSTLHALSRTSKANSLAQMLDIKENKHHTNIEVSYQEAPNASQATVGV
jgi:hypothetical protein